MPSARVILWSWRASKQSKKAENTSITKSSIWKLAGLIPPEIAIGSARTIQILKILLPTMFPTRRSDSPFLAAVTVVTSSGREVPSAMMVREMILSEIPIAVAIVEADWTTSSLPATMPISPRITRKNDFPSLYLGFSTAVFSRRFLRAREIR